MSKDLRRGTRPNHKLPWKRCYETAFRWLFVHHADQEGATLVHGTYQPLSFMVWPAGHAWVELPGEIVFDGVYQRFYDRNNYYAVMEATPQFRYSVQEATTLYFKTNHFGPWEGNY